MNLWQTLPPPWQAAVVEAAVPHFQPHITLGKQLFASGELWQVGQQKPSAAEMLGWLQSKLSG